RARWASAIAGSRRPASGANAKRSTGWLRDAALRRDTSEGNDGADSDPQAGPIAFPRPQRPQPSCCPSRCARRSAGRAICRDQAKLLEHRQLVEEQIERGMFAIAEVEHLDIVDRDPAACRWDVSHQTAEDAHVRPGERALFDGNVADEVSGMDVDMRIR